MKKILIDAIYINTGGALMILNHLINNLVAREVDFVLLKDIRCPKLESEDLIPNCVILPNTIKAKSKYYRRLSNDFTSVLCLGNVPPPIHLSIPVHTYIHNVSLLEIPKTYSLQFKLLSWLKKQYIKFFAKNTTDWIVQTEHTANIVRKHLPCKEKEVLVYPFYYIPEDIHRTAKGPREDYVFIGDHTRAKGHEDLLDAWFKLSKIGINKRLHMTVEYKPFARKIDSCVDMGVNIVNHGRIAPDKVIELYNLSKATIYPSLNESLGLGIIEALNAGCDVIGCDLPYTHSVCRPSITFNPMDSDSIVEAVLEYEKGNCKKSKLLIRDMAYDLIDLLIINQNEQ